MSNKHGLGRVYHDPGASATMTAVGGPGMNLAGKFRTPGLRSSGKAHPHNPMAGKHPPHHGVPRLGGTKHQAITPPVAKPAQGPRVKVGQMSSTPAQPMNFVKHGMCHGAAGVEGMGLTHGAVEQVSAPMPTSHGCGAAQMGHGMGNCQ